MLKKLARIQTNLRRKQMLRYAQHDVQVSSCATNHSPVIPRPTAKESAFP